MRASSRLRSSRRVRSTHRISSNLAYHAKCTLVEFDCRRSRGVFERKKERGERRGPASERQNDPKTPLIWGGIVASKRRRGARSNVKQSAARS